MSTCLVLFGLLGEGIAAFVDQEETEGPTYTWEASKGSLKFSASGTLTGAGQAGKAAGTLQKGWVELPAGCRADTWTCSPRGQS